jgi:glucosamine--fructose-6-phosphate aminotransferase (isomerizing)
MSSMVRPGDVLLGEIREQPAALRRLLAEEERVGAAARALSRMGRPLVRLVAHGSSDNAASYGVYAFGLLAGITAVRDSISLPVYYGADLDFGDSAVLALSQSGETPDVVEYVRLASSRGAMTIALTNERDSALAEAADEVVLLCAEEERSIAATKTYMNELAALALIAAGVGGAGQQATRALIEVAELAEVAIGELEEAVVPLALSLAFVGRMYFVGRGIELATAREIALKLTEVCGVAAESLTATDLAHGPIAAIDPLFPVWAIASDDEALPAVTAAIERARAVGAPIIATGAAARALGDATYRLDTPAAPSAVYCPLLSVIPGQLFAWALARARGLDPDQPRYLDKITMAP